MVAEVKKQKKAVGIYGSHYMWVSIMGAANNCDHFKDIPLWYPHYDNKPSFDDFNQFASWKQPTFKQFMGTSDMCGGSVDLNYSL